MAHFFFLLIMIITAPIVLCSSSLKRKPIVIGVMGSQLEGMIHKSRHDHFYCTKDTNYWFRMWLNIDDILPFSQTCFQDNIKLHYNSSTGQYSNTEGVSIRPYQFGNTTGIENLDPTLKTEANYFKVFVERLVKLGGYRRGVNLRGAPYDWRLGPVQLTQTGYYSQLQSLIQSTYTSQNDTKVILIVHSLGSLVSHYFLTTYVSQSWKDTYLDQYITLGGVWAGTAKILHALISGESDGIFKFSRRLKLRLIERSFPSDYWMAPIAGNSTWNSTLPLVTTPTFNYTAYDLTTLINDLNYHNGQAMYMGVVNARPHPLLSPNITTHCIYGTGLQTEESYHFKKTKYFPNGKFDIRYGDGDGTVGVVSLRACQKWATEGGPQVKWYELDGVEHFDMLNEDRVLDIVQNIVLSDNNKLIN